MDVLSHGNRQDAIPLKTDQRIKVVVWARFIKLLEALSSVAIMHEPVLYMYEQRNTTKLGPITQYKVSAPSLKI